MKTKTKECKHPTCSNKCRRISTPKKAKKRPKPYSKKRQKENRTYSALRKQFLINNPNCQALLEGCTGLATDVHHSRGRTGMEYLNTGLFIPVCRNCHRFIEENPLQAKELGLSESRLSNAVRTNNM